VKKVSFGAEGGGGKLAVKLKDPEAEKHLSRHNCDQKKDKTKLDIGVVHYQDTQNNLD
jgi:hypothetical protein